MEKSCVALPAAIPTVINKRCDAMTPEAIVQRTEVADAQDVDSQAVSPARIRSVIGKLLIRELVMAMRTEPVDGTLRRANVVLNVELEVEMVKSSKLIACVILPLLIPAVTARILDE